MNLRHLFFGNLYLSFSWFKQVDLLEVRDQKLFGNPTDSRTYVDSRVEPRNLVFEVIENLGRCLNILIMDFTIAAQYTVDRSWLLVPVIYRSCVP